MKSIGDDEVDAKDDKKMDENDFEIKTNGDLNQQERGSGSDE